LKKPRLHGRVVCINDLETNTGYHFMLTGIMCDFNVAESFPSVCGHELQMFATVLPDCTVEHPWIINGAPVWLVQARGEAS